MKFVKRLLLKTRLAFTKERNAKEEQVSLQAADKIGLLIYLHENSLKYEVEDFAQQFINEGKEVIGLCFTLKPDTVRFSFPCKYFTLQDIQWNGDLDNETVNKFTKTPFDYLYSINILPILPFELILRKSKAKCRVGKYDEKTDLDLKIQIPSDKDLPFLLEQMILYSSKINTEKAG